MDIPNTSTEPPRVLLAEDDRAVARLIEIAMKRTGIPHDLEIVHDGHQTVAALEGDFMNCPPRLLVLDLFMPGKDGFEVLEYIKQHPHFRRIPVIVFSNSNLPANMIRAYDLQANAYVVKSTDFADLCRAMDAILRFWLQIAASPF
jgi:CheY-like chemotaxis protein